MDNTQIGLVTLAATQGFTIFTTMMPNRTMLYNCNPQDPTVRQNVRHGELTASVLVLGFAGVLAYLSKSNIPWKIAGATVVTMIVAYEYTLRMQPIGDTAHELS